MAFVGATSQRIQNRALDVGRWMFDVGDAVAPPVLFEEIITVLDPEPHSAALNMALDEALLQRARLPTLRIYDWRAPAVSFGYFGKYVEAQKVAAGREMVRRWTGGGIVEHGADVTYTLLVPRGAAFLRHGAPESYRLIHERIGDWLGVRGIGATVAQGAAQGAASTCFASHVRYDVLAKGIKLAGAAQRRTRWGLLHQGSIQASLSDRVGLAEIFAGRVQRKEITRELAEDAHQIAQEKYATPHWLRKF
jgi:lipoate-protein ligase A